MNIAVIIMHLPLNFQLLVLRLVCLLIVLEKRVSSYSVTKEKRTIHKFSVRIRYVQSRIYGDSPLMKIYCGEMSGICNLL